MDCPYTWKSQGAPHKCIRRDGHFPGNHLCVCDEEDLGDVIACICGSTRFAEEMREVNRDLTLKGYIVLAPGVFQRQGDELTPDEKDLLDSLHLRKIDLAHLVVIVNPGNYIGQSTRRELNYASLLKKTIRFTHPEGH